MKFTLLYSKKDSNLDTIYLRHRYKLNGKPTELKIKTNFEIKKENWDPINQIWNLDCKIKSPRKSEDKILNKEIDDFNLLFGTLKKKIKDYIDLNPYPSYEEIHTLIFGAKATALKQNETLYPELFSDFIDFYIKEKSITIPGKQKAITVPTKNRYIQIQTRLNKYYPGIKITNIDDNFRDNYAVFMDNLNYKSSFIIKELKFIKTFCRYADKKLNINKEVLHWSFINTESIEDKFEDPIFSFDELEQLKKVKLDSGHLQNAKDWLLISCYTGQRVSDLLKMNSENITNKEFYKVIQQKGQKEIIIWLMPEVFEILNKRNGEFPRKISSQKYNDYIKIVAQKAGIEQIIKGGKEIEKRKVIDHYPKWELVTSHIGRRTFVSLFESIIGKDLIKVQTGHVTDAMVNLYNKNSAITKAKKIKAAYENYLNIPESDSQSQTS